MGRRAGPDCNLIAGVACIADHTCCRSGQVSALEVHLICYREVHEHFRSAQLLTLTQSCKSLKQEPSPWIDGHYSSTEFSETTASNSGNRSACHLRR